MARILDSLNVMNASGGMEYSGGEFFLAEKYGGGPFRRRRFGAGQLGAVPFRRRTFRHRFLIFLYFSNEEKTMKQAIP